MPNRSQTHCNVGLCVRVVKLSRFDFGDVPVGEVASFPFPTNVSPFKVFDFVLLLSNLLDLPIQIT